MVSCAYRNDIELTCVILGGTLSPDGISSRFTDSITLYEYGFNHFSLKNIANPGDIITAIEVPNATPSTKSLDLAFVDSIYALVNNSDLDTNYIPEIYLNSDISAPIAEGDVLGKAIYTIDGISYEADIVATHTVENSQLLQFILQIGGLFIAFLITFVIFFSNRKKKKDLSNI